MFKSCISDLYDEAEKENDKTAGVTSSDEDLADTHSYCNGLCDFTCPSYEICGN